MPKLSHSLNEESNFDWLPTFPVRVAILDMNNGMRNMGIRNIKRIVRNFEFLVTARRLPIEITMDHFHVRDRDELPDSGYDIYISSGGPGSPLEDTGSQWELRFFKLLDELTKHNDTEERKKYFFGICHSFQLMAKKFQIGEISKRERRNLGIVPIVRTGDGIGDVIFEGLLEKFYAFDNRDWQVNNPDARHVESIGAKILSHEADHDLADRAITGIRFSNEMEAVQFHPEAEKNAILQRFMDPEERKHIVEMLGEKPYDEFIQSVENPNKLLKTYKTILPGFLRRAFNSLMRYYEQPQLEK